MVSVERGGIGVKGWVGRVKSETFVIGVRAFEGHSYNCTRQASSADFNSALPLKIPLGSFPVFRLFISAIKYDVSINPYNITIRGKIGG